MHTNQSPSSRVGAQSGAYRGTAPGATLYVSAPRYPSGSSMPACWQAAVTVLASRQAMVMGPTPPGTGVIAPATHRRVEIDIADQPHLAFRARRAGRPRSG